MPTPHHCFKVGQVWKTRGPTKVDSWRIEAITDHPTAPVIARSTETTSIRPFGLDGGYDGDLSEYGPCSLDLVTLLQDAPQ